MRGENGRNGATTTRETADVVIVGGGVNGVAAAFQLAKRGVRKVVVLERRQLGAGATGKSGALVRCHYANVPESQLTLESLRIFRNWDDEVGHGGSGFDPIGFIQVVSTQDADKLRANVAAQQAIGPAQPNFADCPARQPRHDPGQNEDREKDQQKCRQLRRPLLFDVRREQRR